MVKRYDNLKNMYLWGPTSKPEAIFPFTRMISGKNYTQSLINPDLCKNCTEKEAKARVEQLRREGWSARIVEYPGAPGCHVYLVYERKTKKVGDKL
jgi:hypothetical protein